MERYVLRATCAVLPFRLRSGDYVVVDLELDVPVSGVRCDLKARWNLPPNYGMVALLLEEGVLNPVEASVSPSSTLASLRRLAATG